MEESKKKVVMICTIMACLVIAGLFLIKTFAGKHRSQLDAIPDDEIVYVKCKNSSCNAEYQMKSREYHKQLLEKTNPASMVTPPVTCRKCNKDSCYLAVKCRECGFVFFENSVPRDFSDRCPKCKFSSIENRRNRN